MKTLNICVEAFDHEDDPIGAGYYFTVPRWIYNAFEDLYSLCSQIKEIFKKKEKHTSVQLQPVAQHYNCRCSVLSDLQYERIQEFCYREEEE